MENARLRADDAMQDGGAGARRDRSLDLSAPLDKAGAVRRDRSLDLPAPGTRETLYPRRRSSPRLAGFDYGEGHAYAITIVTDKRRRVFAEAARADKAVEKLTEAADHGGLELDAYCVMPDHVHILAMAPARSHASVEAFVHRFKQATGYAYRQRTGQSLWQRSYYDHVLRASESIADYAAYIIGNPVRAGLRDTPGAWLYSGPLAAIDAFDGTDRSKDLSLRNALSPPVERRRGKP